MSELSGAEQSLDPSRREFLKTASALAAGGTVLGLNSRVLRAAHSAGSDEIKVALIGCGGRGMGAAVDALATKGPVTLWTMADAFADRLELCLDQTKSQVERGRRDGDPLFEDSKINVPNERQFVGFDAYKGAIDSGA